jgi:hypothetical protein
MHIALRSIILIIGATGRTGSGLGSASAPLNGEHLRHLDAMDAPCRLGEVHG